METLTAELDLARDLARAAASVIMKYYQSDALRVDDKGDLGPVTTADREADSLIAHGLSAAFPEDGLLTEEGSLCRPGVSGRRWFVDPIDGTREFIAGRTDFAVMIGLSIGGSPALGVVFRPATGALAWGVVGRGAWSETPSAREPLRVSAHSALAEARVVRSFSHPSAAVDTFCARSGAKPGPSMGSFGLKCVEVARGVADLYVNLSSKTALWDSAGPSAIVLAAGGQVSTPEGVGIDYATAPTFHPTGVLVSNGLLHAPSVRVLASMKGGLP